MTGIDLTPLPQGCVPRVWVVASHRPLGNEHGHPQPYTLVDEGGTRALVDLGLQPVCYPHVPVDRLAVLLATAQGVLLGGSATNVHPCHYGEEPAEQGMAFDAEREAVALPLVRLCIEHGVPLIGFCRGSHEINVALGGSLHQNLKALARPVVHWESPDESLQQQYRERHEVSLLPGGALEHLTGGSRFGVSSLHSQGVKRLGAGLVAEAFADDGLVEAFRWHDTRQFAWGFQFHPEFGHERHPHYARIMAAFVEACQARLQRDAAVALRAWPGGANDVRDVSDVPSGLPDVPDSPPAAPTLGRPGEPAGHRRSPPAASAQGGA